MIRAARREGLPITCDVAVNHIHLSEMDIGYFDSNCHLVPPLRALSDREALRAGLRDGTIDAICSDHAPVDRMPSCFRLLRPKLVRSAWNCCCP